MTHPRPRSRSPITPRCTDLRRPTNDRLRSCLNASRSTHVGATQIAAIFGCSATTEAALRGTRRDVAERLLNGVRHPGVPGDRACREEWLSPPRAIGGRPDR